MTAILEVRDLSVTYAGDRRAVRGVSFDVAPGETVALVGESGSGKSATAYALMRILAPGAIVGAGSRALFEGVDLFAIDDAAMRAIRGRRLAMVFQDPAAALNPSMRVGDQVAEVALVHGETSRRAAHDRAVAMLERTGLRDPARRARDYPHQLSGGMRQRVMIAMALLLQPALIIADEPTSALDVTVQAQILDLVVDLQREAGTAFLLITHDLAIVAECCTRALVMHDGVIVESGTTDQIFHAPVHPYTSALVGGIQRLVLPV